MPGPGPGGGGPHGGGRGGGPRGGGGSHRGGGFGGGGFGGGGLRPGHRPPPPPHFGGWGYGRRYRRGGCLSYCLMVFIIIGALISYIF